MAKFLQLPINDKLEKEDINIKFPQQDNYLKIYTKRYVKLSPERKYCFVNKIIHQDLISIFKHFQIQNGFIDDLIIDILTAVQFPILRIDWISEETSKNERYYKAYWKLKENPIFEKYPTIFKVIKNLKDYKIVTKNLMEQKLLIEFFKSSRAPKKENRTKYNFDKKSMHLTKVCWVTIVNSLINNHVKLKNAINIATYMLGYFFLIHRKHFDSAAKFNDIKKTFVKLIPKEEIKK